LGEINHTVIFGPDVLWLGICLVKMDKVGQNSIIFDRHHDIVIFDI